MSARALKLFLLAAALAFAPAAAQTAPQPRALAQEHAYSHGLLWKIEGAQTGPSYLFGTIHVSDPRVLALPQPVRQNFDRSTSFAMEVNLDGANLAQLANRMFLTDGRDLPRVIGAELFERVAAAGAGLGLPPEALRLFKPWAVALFMIMPQSDPQNVLDQRLHRMAVEQNKGVHQLETVDEQVDTFDNMSEREQIAFLRSAVENRQHFPKMIQRTIDLYLARDLAALHKLNDEYASSDPQMIEFKAAFMQRLFDRRNVRMADRADALLKQGGAFIAVGALHLYGERGMLALLAARGYRVSRVY
jgi:uncharacterized protein YbaP (TraB family)